jgi:hypothetical protein
VLRPDKGGIAVVQLGLRVRPIQRETLRYA